MECTCSRSTLKTDNKHMRVGLNSTGGVDAEHEFIHFVELCTLPIVDVVFGNETEYNSRSVLQAIF